jgi:hypothetical protein
LLILATLNREETPLSGDDIRMLSALVLMACYDRKVEREFLAEVIETMSEMHDCVGVLEKGVSYIYILSEIDPERTPSVLGGAIKEWGEEFTRLRRKLASYMEKLVECPTAADRIS